jgi:2-succinyl-5-enolpyruvyl-6-hydroxy-3-cyclohexene-1-carboxylate synthase
MEIGNHTVAPADAQYAAVCAFVDALVHAGVAHACVCPGARSTPLALALAAHAGVRAWSHIDERSAAFFALGMAKTARRPVVVACTSGTAAANCFPAVVEAASARVPLIVLTADRPAELRDCGAGQTIDQLKLYGSFVRWFAEAGGPESGTRYFRALAARAVAAACRHPQGPVHVNFPFREPLLPNARDTGLMPAAVTHTRVHEGTPILTDAAVEDLSAALAAARRGLILCGPADHDAAFPAAVAALAARLAFPILADPLSQVRTGRHDTTRVVATYDALLRDDAFAAAMAPDLIVRFGAMPTSKACLQFVERQACRHLAIDPSGAWNDPALAATDLIRAEPVALCTVLARRLDETPRDERWCARWLAAERQARAALAARLAAGRELHEPRVFAELAALLPDDAILYVGNSIPVRALEGFWPVGSRPIRFLCNRGANGIDGFVSSALGAAATSDTPMVAITGDLGFLHDLNGLLAVTRYGLRATIVVLNNDGGGIFSFLPQARAGAAFAEFFLTPHGLDFRAAVEMYGAGFARVASWEQFRDAVRAALGAPRTTVIEVPIDRARSVAIHHELWAAARGVLEASA